jgi:hypothetical protein
MSFWVVSWVNVEVVLVMGMAGMAVLLGFVEEEGGMVLLLACAVEAEAEAEELAVAAAEDEVVRI